MASKGKPEGRPGPKNVPPKRGGSDRELSDGGEPRVEQAQLAVQRALVDCHGRLHEILRRRLGNADEAEDVLQSFMVRALERASDLRDVDSVRSWLGRVLSTAVADHYRRGSRRRQGEHATEPEVLANLLPTVDAELDEATCSCLYRLLPTLRPSYADVLWRADLVDEPREQIALALGTSVANVTVRLHRARRELSQRLLETCWSCPIHGFRNCQCNERRPTPDEARTS